MRPPYPLAPGHFPRAAAPLHEYAIAPSSRSRLPPRRRWSRPAGRRVALIVEDEPLARLTLRRLLAADGEMEVVGEAWGPGAPERIVETGAELVLLDVQMPGMDGFEVLRRVPPERLPLVIFITAYDEYAVRAFELRALDYVLKPFTDARPREALGRAKEQVRSREQADAQRRLLALLSGGRAPQTPPPALSHLGVAIVRSR